MLITFLKLPAIYPVFTSMIGTELRRVDFVAEHCQAEKDNSNVCFEIPEDNTEPTEDTNFLQISPPDPSTLNNQLREIFLKSMTHFYCKSNTPISNATEISEMLKNAINFTCESLKNEIGKCTSLEEVQSFIDNVELDDEEFRSFYMFKKHLKERGAWFPGKKFTISNRFEINIDDVDDDEDMESYQGIVMPIEQQIKTFIELPGVLKAMLDTQNIYVGLSEEEPISHFCQGRLWKDIVSKNVGKTVIPLMIYSDDFEIDDSRGPHAGDNSITGFYYQFPSLPSHLKSTLQFIFVAMLAYAKHIKECSPDSALYMLLNIFLRLEVDGIEVLTNTGRLQKIHIVLTNCQGDNLGIHVLCGFAGFNAKFYCRFCLIEKEKCQYLCTNKNIVLRTITEYDRMLLDGSHTQYGIARRCILNGLPNFHVLINFIVDLMHDLMLGVFRYDLKAVIGHYISTGFLNLDDLNSRLKKWNFGVKETIRFTEIKKEHFNEKGSGVHMKAREVWFFVENLPFLLHGMVPTNDIFFQFVLVIHDLQDICLQPEFGREELYLLDYTIERHHTLYRVLFQKELTPKFHFLLHYAEVIKRCGPLKDLMCFRLEAKHQEIKLYTNVSHNRRNVLVSIANKQSLVFSNTILSFDKNVLTDYVTSMKKSKGFTFSETVLDAVKMFLDQNNRFYESLMCSEQITYKGTVFARNEYLIIDDDTAGLMKGFVTAGDSVIVMYNILPICFQEDMRAYFVLDTTDPLILYNFIEDFNYVPVPGNMRNGVSFIKKLKRYSV